MWWAKYIKDLGIQWNADVYLSFAMGATSNQGLGQHCYPLSNGKTSPTWWYSILFDTGDVVLIDKFERLAEVKATVPTAVSGGWRKVVQGVNSILGAVCTFDGSNDVNGFLTTGKLSDGSAIPSCLPRGFKPLPYGVNNAWSSYVPFLTGTGSIGVETSDNTVPFGSYKRVTIPTGSSEFAQIRPRTDWTVPAGESKKVSFWIKDVNASTGQFGVYYGAIPSDGAGVEFECTSDFVVMPTPGSSHNLFEFNGEVGWFKLTITFTAGSGGWIINQSSPIRIYPNTYQASGGDSLDITDIRFDDDDYGPIPTSGSAVTRYADIPQFPADLIGSDTQLTFIAKCSFKKWQHEIIFERQDCYIKRHASNNRIYIYDNLGISSDVAYQPANTDNMIEKDETCTVIVVLDDDRLDLYVNANLETSTQRDLGASSFGRADMPLNIGQDSGSTPILNPIEYAAVMKRVLTADEVRELHNFLMGE